MVVVVVNVVVVVVVVVLCVCVCESQSNPGVGSEDTSESGEKLSTMAKRRHGKYLKLARSTNTNDLSNSAFVEFLMKVYTS